MTRIVFIFACFILALAGGQPLARAQAATAPHPPILVIANSSIKAGTASKSELRDIFSGESSHLKDGAHVIPILIHSGPATDEFLAVYLNQNDASFRASLRTLVFSGQATMPRSFETEAAAVDFITHTAGTIGYITRATPHEGVKVLASH